MKSGDEARCRTSRARWASLIGGIAAGYAFLVGLYLGLHG